MWAALIEIGKLMSLRWQGLVEIGAVAGVAVLAWCRMQWNQAERQREQRVRGELEAYAQLDARLPQDGDVGKLARRVCQLVTESSAFKRVGMLVRDAEGRLYVADSIGMEDVIVQALNAWGEGVVQAERTGEAGAMVVRGSALEARALRWFWGTGWRRLAAGERSLFRCGRLQEGWWEHWRCVPTG
jgi:hypothetical protein